MQKSGEIQIATITALLLHASIAADKTAPHSLKFRTSPAGSVLSLEELSEYLASLTKPIRCTGTAAYEFLMVDCVPASTSESRLAARIATWWGTKIGPGKVVVHVNEEEVIVTTSDFQRWTSTYVFPFQVEFDWSMREHVDPSGIVADIECGPQSKYPVRVNPLPPAETERRTDILTKLIESYSRQHRNNRGEL